jgi:hypothetical protein
MTRKKQYTEPELTLVGATDEVVFGLVDVGADYANEFYVAEMDFAAD